MPLPLEAKKLISTEIKNLRNVRKRIKHFFIGTVAGSALQVYRIKHEMQNILAEEILTAKTTARQERIKFLENIFGIEGIPTVTDKDYVLSNMAAESFSNAWATANIMNVALDLDARLRKIVATETARSYSDVVMEAADEYKLVRRWNAILDNKVCSFCAEMDGKETLPGETFEDGVEPGWAHPFCRCLSELVIK